MLKYWVLMGNDYPDGILYGTEEQAREFAKKQDTKNGRVRWYVETYEVKVLGLEST